MFNREILDIKPLSDRVHDLDLSVIKPLSASDVSIPDGISAVSKHLVAAKEKCAAVVLMIGAHVIRSGVQRYIIDLMERGFISCLALNGAGVIHDFEFSLIGATTESVEKYIKNGQFGLWKETSRINDIINSAYLGNHESGMGRSVGKVIETESFPHRDISLLAAGYRLNIPVTVHVGIGYDIIHEHPNCNGAAIGALSYNDFLSFASVVQNLEYGVAMNFGSAIMAPEVYLKALSMARNVARQEGKHIKDFTTLVCDLQELPENFNISPSKNNPSYYFRPWKTMLVRTVTDGGRSFYVRGKHSETVPALWSAINKGEKSKRDENS